MDNPEYIDSFFDGEFSPEEAGRFEKRIQEDPAFADEVALYLGALAASREANARERKARFRELYNEGARPAAQRNTGQAAIKSTGQTPIRKMPPRRWFTVAAAAAVLSIVALTWLLFLKPADPPTLASRYIRQNLAVLSAKMGTADRVQKGIVLYNSGIFPGAMQQFNDELRVDSLNPAALLYAGIVSLRMENYDKALDFFIKLASHTDPHVNPAFFYEALTLMRRNHAGDSDHAKQILQQIVKQDLNKKGDALELLSKL